jgi:hypothetical protein
VFASRFDLKEWQILQNYTIRYSGCESVLEDSPILWIPMSRLTRTTAPSLIAMIASANTFKNQVRVRYPNQIVADASPDICEHLGRDIHVLSFIPYVFAAISGQ